LHFLAEGDANTKFFNLQAYHRKRNSRIQSLLVQGAEVSDPSLLAQATFDHYNSILGSNFERTQRIDLTLIGLPSMDLQNLEVLFTEAEVRAVVADLPNERAPGPDGFTGLFYKLAWDVISQTSCMHSTHSGHRTPGVCIC
jgi:hypothetical protein